MISHSDIILCYLPKIFTVGTIEEIFVADSQYKPIVFVFEGEAIVSLYAADLFNRHVVTSGFNMALGFLNGINEKGFEYFDGPTDWHTVEDKCRWLPITHKAL
jgi:hypothetical protein